MGNYELFRAELASRLASCVPEDLLLRVLAAVDDVSAGYDISRQTTDIIPADGIPEAVRLYIASKAVEQLSKLTLVEYKRVLVKFFQTVRKPVQEVSANDIRVYLFRYEESRGIQKETVEHLRIVLNSFFEWLALEEIIPKNPAKRISPIHTNPKEQPRMTTLELEKMRCACQDLREKALVDFLYSTGARVSEVRAGLITDVDIASGVYLIRHGKGDKERKTYLNAEALLSLQAYLSTRKDDSPYLFVSVRGHHSMTSKAIQDIISKIRSRTDITKRITPHAFRRTTATIGTANGMSVQEMQKLLGHANINTTMRYVAVADESVKTDHSKYIA